MTKPNAKRDRSQGSALLVAVLLLVLMGAVGLAGLDAVTLDQQTAGFGNQKRHAFWAAEAGIAEAREAMRNGGEPVVTDGTTMGDTQLFEYGQPSYTAEEITDLGTQAVPGFQLRTTGNGPTFQLHYYRVRVRGDAINGTQARVEVVAHTMDTSGGN